jgi:hypothetical protein
MWHVITDLIAIAHGFLTAGNAASTCVSNVAVAARPLDVVLLRHRWDMP